MRTCSRGVCFILYRDRVYRSIGACGVYTLLSSYYYCSWCLLSSYYKYTLLSSYYIYTLLSSYYIYTLLSSYYYCSWCLGACCIHMASYLAITYIHSYLAITYIHSYLAITYIHSYLAIIIVRGVWVPAVYTLI